MDVDIDTFQGLIPKSPASKINRHDFPKDFIWGTATSAYQVEGAYDADGKSLSNWDVFALNRPDAIADGSNGCVAIDQYHRYKEDVMQIKKLGLDAYRFTINWSRILPGGRLSSGVNRAGVQYYNDLIDFCLAQDIVPFVLIFHFDMPQNLEDEYGGFLSPNIVQDFGEFAKLCFWEFGDRVKHWMTLNEPWSFVYQSYIAGVFPPGRATSQNVRLMNTGVVQNQSRLRTARPIGRSAATRSVGDESTDPYICGHHLILAHALAVDIYRNLFQAAQGGIIGITNLSHWYEPLNPDDPADVAAAERAVDFMWGWFMSPIVHGDYPAVMRQLVGKRLPQFTPEQVKLVQGSYDFIGLQYYTSNYAANAPTPPNTPPTYQTDQQNIFLTERDGVPIGESPGSPWLFIVPRGIYNLLTHTKDKYNDPIIYITEQGMSIKNDTSITVAEALKDEMRINAYHDHLMFVKQAMDHNRVKVKSYFLWSMFDNYEWVEGYTVRFGIFYVDYLNRLARHPKDSAIWWMNFLNKNHGGRMKRVIKANKEEQKESGKKLKMLK